MHECSVHIIVYHDPQENYVGMDVFANYDTALACWTSELQRCRKADCEKGIVDLIRNEPFQNLYFRTGRGFECFYRDEVLQNEVAEIKED